MGEHRKGSGGNSHQRAVQAAATGVVDTVPTQNVVRGGQPLPSRKSTPESTQRRRHPLSDSLAILTFPAALLMWAFIPTFGLRIVAMVVAIVAVAYLSYRAVWAPQRRWVQHILALSATLVILAVGIGQLRNQWKAEHHAVVAGSPAPPASPNPAPQKQSQPLPSNSAPSKPISSASVPATAASLFPLTIEDVNKIVHRIGNPYQSQHPNAGRLELQAAINKELAREGYVFRVTLPQLPADNGVRLDLEFNGVTLRNTNPDNKMTGVSVGNRSKVTVTGGGIEGFDNGIKTGNDSPVDINDTHLTARKPTAPTESSPAENVPETKPQ